MKFLYPQLLSKLDTPFNSSSYYSELKFDGYRMLFSKTEKNRLFTRHKNEVTANYKEISEIEIPSETMLDGELIVTDHTGKPNFEALQNYKQNSLYQEGNLQFVVFDILRYKGQDLTALPLYKRKEYLLEAIPQNQEKIVPVQWTEGHGVELYELTKGQNLEGIVMKDKNSPYSVAKRHPTHWYKLVHYQTEIVKILGYKRNEFGLLIDKESNGKFEHVSIMEFMTKNDRAMFYQLAKNLKTHENNDFIYIKPEITCKIKYRHLTSQNKFRIPSFIEFVTS